MPKNGSWHKPHTLKKFNSKLTLSVKYKSVELLEENI